MASRKLNEQPVLHVFKNLNKLYTFNLQPSKTSLLFTTNLSFVFLISSMCATFYNFLFINIHKNLNLRLFRNNYFLSLNTKNYRRNFSNTFTKKYLYLTNYKFLRLSRFFNYLESRKLQSVYHNTRYSLKPKENLNFRPNFYFGSFRPFLSKNFFFLVGNLNNPYSWNLLNFKFNKIDNLVFSKKKNKSSLKLNKTRSSKKTFFNKKMFINNFFYISKNKLVSRSSLLKNFYFIKSLHKKKVKKNLSKPYLFMNNNPLFRVTYFFNKKLYNNFKKSSKIFNFLKRLNFKKKHKAKLFLNKFNLSRLVKPRVLSLIVNKNFKKQTNLIKVVKKQKSYFFSRPLSFFIRKKRKYFVLNLRNSLILKLIKNSSLLNLLFSKNSVKFFFLTPKNYRFRIKKLIKFKKIHLIFSVRNKSKSSYTRFKFYTSIRSYNRISTPSPFNFYTKTNNFGFNFVRTPAFILPKYSKPLFFRNPFIFSKVYSNTRNFNLFFKFKINTKTKCNTSFSLNGFLFLTSSMYFSPVKKENTFLLKKILYSFSYKNEMQKYILKKYLKSKFLLVPEKTSNSRPGGISSETLNFNSYSKTVFNKDYFSTPFDLSANSFSFFTGYLSNSNWIKSTIDEQFSMSLFSVDYTFSIKRIKFKPGYMTMWRSARDTLKSLLDLKFQYQYKLTKYLNKFKKSNRISSALLLEMRLSNVVFKSKILPDANAVDLFINSNLIFVNGVVCRNPNFHLFVGDFIQFVVSTKYYILNRWMLHWAVQKRTRLKLKSKRKITPVSFSDDKQQSNLMPSWILKNKNLVTDCSKFIEVDYFTLSIFVLYEPFNLLDINPYNFMNIRYGVINLYNWKYIT